MTVRQALKEAESRYARAIDFESHAFWRSRPIVPHTVLYESFSGNGMLCNPRAIFESLLDDPAYSRLKHTWVLESAEDIEAAQKKWRGCGHVRFVRKESYAYYRALATSHYLVNNSTFPYQFSKRPGQVYLNTWHGTPLKKMGFDMAEGGSSSRNVVRNFLMADYLLSSSPFMTEQMYASSYKLRGIFRGKILESGQPRVDVQLVEGARDRARDELAAAGIALDGRKTVVFAPTWRGSFYQPLDETQQLLDVVQRIQESVGNDYVVLLKTHQVAYRFAAAGGLGSGTIIPNDVPTNVVLAGTDMLVTDYSSIFFDALPTRTPIAHYAPDAAQYDGARGLYEPIENLPGPVATTLDELEVVVRDLAGKGLDGLDDQRHRNYERFVEKYVPHEDGGATRRVIENVFGGRESGIVHSDLHDDGRTSILIYIGGLKSNGITTSALNLLSSIDPDKFDVTAFYGPPRSAEGRKYEGMIPASVRTLPRVGGFNGSKRHRATRQATFDALNSKHSQAFRKHLDTYFTDEWHRCFGDARFDHVVDFSGYGPMWPNILLAAPTGSKAIWQHNDVVADSKKEINGRLRHGGGLVATFSTYRYFDRVVSVSADLAQINASKLAKYAPAEKFFSARNLMDAERVQRLAGVNVDHSPRRAPRDDERIGTDAVSDLEFLADIYTHETIDEAWGHLSAVRAAFPPRGRGKRFITMGRISPEKNHARLVDAFAQVVAQEPDSHLAILGSGPLDQELHAQVSRLGLGSHIRLTGFQSNPYAALAEADCFVLSSDYEGQPLVILEARTLGIPVITTDFGSSRSALAEDEGLIVPRDTYALAQGMLRFIRSGIPQQDFDVNQYNRDAMNEFLNAIGAQQNQ